MARKMEPIDTDRQTLGDGSVPDFIIIGAAKCGTT